MSKVRFDEMIQVFKLYCKSKGLADRTLQTYESSLEKLRDYLNGYGTDSEVITPNHLRGFVAEQLEKGLSRSSVAIHVRSIRVFFNFLAREGLVERNPMRNVETPKVPQTYPQVLSEEQIKRLIKACNRSTWVGIRNYTMLLTFLDTGIRLSELIGLNLEDVNLQNWTIRIRNGKGSKERYVFIGRSLFRALRKWIDVRGVSCPDPAFFITNNGHRHDPRNVERIIERLAQRAKLNGTRVTPHILRHSFATHYIKNGGDPFSLQRILGHSDIKTTMIYVNLAGVGLREAHAKASPVDNMFTGAAK
jgi:integrase/recombinase XerD